MLIASDTVDVIKHISTKGTWVYPLVVYSPTGEVGHVWKYPVREL